MFWYGRKYRSDFEWVRLSIVTAVAEKPEPLRVLYEAFERAYVGVALCLCRWVRPHRSWIRGQGHAGPLESSFPTAAPSAARAI